MTDAPGSGAPLDPRPGGLGGRSFALYLTIFLSALGSGVAVPILPDLQAVFGLSVAEVTLVVSIWALMRLVVDLPLGAVVDRLPRGRLLLVGSLAAVGGSLVSMVAPSFEVLLAGRALSGLGSATIGLSGVVSLLAITPADRRGRALGFYQATMQAGFAIGPVLGGLAAALVDWHAAFAVAVVGAGLASVTLVASGVAGGSAPAARSGRGRADAASAGPPATRSRRGLIAAIHLSTFALFFVTGGIIDSALPLFGSSRIGLDAATIGLILGVATGLRFLVSLVGAELSDRIGRLPILLVGMAVLIASLVILPLTAAPTAFALVTWTLAAGRLGNSIPVAMLGDVSDSSRMGRLVGVNRFVADTALVVGPFALGLVAEAAGFPAAFWLAATLVAGATLVLALAVAREPAAFAPVRGT